MSSSREESPDWLRSFQPPSRTVVLLSDSDSLPDASPPRDDEVDRKEPSLFEMSPSTKEERNQDIFLGKSGADSPNNNLSKAKSPSKRRQARNNPPTKGRKSYKRRRGAGNEGGSELADEGASKKPRQTRASHHSLLSVSSDSEASPENSPKREDNIYDEEPSEFKAYQTLKKVKDEDANLFVGDRESPYQNASKQKSPKKRRPTEEKKITGTAVEDVKVADDMKTKGNGDVEVTAEDASEKHLEPRVSSSRLPLVLPEKVNRTKALVECEGDSIDLSGDIGAVGRVVVSDTPSGQHEMYLDLKGTIYRTTIVPCRTFCVVSFGQSEAKIEAIMNDFIQLKPQSNVYEAETMVEGTLEGFSFDSEDEGDKIPKDSSHQADQKDDDDEDYDGTKKKANRAGTTRKKGKNVGEKPQPKKKGRKKTLVSKRGKNKK